MTTKAPCFSPGTPGRPDEESRAAGSSQTTAPAPALPITSGPLRLSSLNNLVDCQEYGGFVLPIFI